jgi:hypothetical protein
VKSDDVGCASADGPALLRERTGRGRTGGSVAGAGVARLGGDIRMRQQGRTNADVPSCRPSDEDLRDMRASVPMAEEVEGGLGGGEVLLRAVSRTAAPIRRHDQ